MHLEHNLTNWQFLILPNQFKVPFALLDYQILKEMRKAHLNRISLKSVKPKKITKNNCKTISSHSLWWRFKT